MQITIKAPEILYGKIALPASKSISNRALILNALSEGGPILENLAVCDDTNVMVTALSSDDRIKNIGAAGTSMRFLTAYLSLLPGEWELTGTERMKNRPVAVLADALINLGAEISYTEKPGFPPLRISGKHIEGGKIEVDGSISSQYLSALMMAGPKMKKGLVLQIKGSLISRPYAEMTLKMMEIYGVKAEWIENEISIPAQNYKPTKLKIESDWSAASYWYEMLCLAEKGEIFLEGLESNSLQGDSGVAKLFKDLGINTEYQKEGVKLTKEWNPVDTFCADLSDQPDLAQTLVMTCLLKGIKFRITGLQSLKIKETDRIIALITESGKLGFDINECENNGLEWRGFHCESDSPAIIETYEDHRMAMAFAPAAITKNDIVINNPEVVSKSYPNYWKDLEAIGFTIKNSE